MDGEPREITGNEGVTVFVRLSRVQELSGLGRSTIYRLMALQLFPRAVRLGPRAVGWRLGDIAAWGAARPDLMQGQARSAGGDPADLVKEM